MTPKFINRRWRPRLDQGAREPRSLCTALPHSGVKENEEQEPSERWAWRRTRVETAESPPARAPEGGALKEAPYPEKGSYSNLFPSLARTGLTGGVPAGKGQ